MNLDEYHALRFEDHPAEKWTPIRYLRQDAICDFCQYPIRAGKPGSSTGTRGTRCWWNAWRRVYECLSCRSEAVRAEIAWQELLDRRRLEAGGGAA